MATPPADSSEWKPPDAFEEYRMVRELGRGAMGHVYLAHDTLLDRPVAVKFIAADEPDADTRERFYIEARAVARLQHPNVVAVYRVGEIRRRPYLVSEYLRGESLDQLSKPVPWRRALEIGIQLARGLAAAHRRGVLHRDIKPANAMLTEDGGVKLLDFGLAKLLDALGPLANASAAAASSAPRAAEETLPPKQGPLAVRTLSLPGSSAEVDPSRRLDASPVGARTLSLPADGAAFRPSGSLGIEPDASGAPPAHSGSTLGPTPGGRPEVAGAAPVAAAPSVDAVTHAGSASSDGSGAEPAAVQGNAHAADSSSKRTLLRPEQASMPVVPASEVPDIGAADTRKPRSDPAFRLPEPTATVDLPAGNHVLEAARAAVFTNQTASPTASPNSERARLTEVGAVLGSPLYMAPEAWRSEPATARTDIYSLGVLLYELCAGEPPWSGLSIPAIAVNVMTREAPSLRSVAPDVEPAFAAVIDRCLRSDPNERFESGETLREALETLTAPASVSAVLPEGNPYRGLMAFEAEHRGLFFGRGLEIRALLDRLRSEPWVAIAGDSGVGKSSLGRAGVVPAVADGALGGEAPRVVTVVPGRRPIASLAAGLAPYLDRDEAEVAANLKARPAELGRSLRRRLPKGGLFLFVDQLEELVTVSDAEEARAVAEALGSLALPGSGLHLLTTARSDFLGRLAALPVLGDGLARALYLLKPLGPDGVREAVVAPARAKGFSFENEAMVDALVAAATRTDGSLPLLQFALSELWNARDQDRRQITAGALDRMGGVAGALARHADHVIEGLVGASRPAARRLLLKLVTAEGTRARRSEAELVGGEPAARAALEALVQGRLVVARDADEGEGAYEIAHEALISSWTTLRGWLSSNLETRAARQRLETAAAEWNRLGRIRESLWSQRQLDEVSAIHGDDLGASEQAFVAASRAELRRRRAVRITAMVLVPLVIAGLAAGVELKAAIDLRREIGAHLSEATSLLATASREEAASDAARQQAFAAFDRGDSAKGETLWDGARVAGTAADSALGDSQRTLLEALQLNPLHEEVRDRLAEATYRRVLLARRDRRHTAAEANLERLRDYDLSRAWLQRLSAPSTLEISSEPAGAAVRISYFDDDNGRFRLGEPVSLGRTPLSAQVEPRSAVLMFSAPGRPEVRFPVMAAPDAREQVSVRLPEQVPRGMVFIPAGPFLYGADEDDELRRGFLDAMPMHRRETGDFLIGRREVTFAEWMAFLRELPPAERGPLIPVATKGRMLNALELRLLPDGLFQLSLTPTSHTYVAKEGEPIRYPGRSVRPEVDWRQLPVTGLSYENARVYAAWLDRTGAIPRARLCREDEWEKAARGVDGRPYPCGTTLRPSDANFDLTYGRHPLGFGPDPVGTYSDCKSPFDVEDIAGNAWEWVETFTSPVLPAFRGGSYFETTRTQRVANRNIGEANLRDPRFGLRMCADVR